MITANKIIGSEIKMITDGTSPNIKKAKKVTKIGLNMAKEIPFDTSKCSKPTKNNQVPIAVVNTPNRIK